MKKLNIKKTSVVLDEKMNKKDLILEVKEAEALKKSIMKQLYIIYKSFEQMDTILVRLSMKKSFDEEYNGFVIQCAKRCAAQAQAAKSLIINLDSKFNEDQKEIIIQDLDDRISFLEKQLSKMN